MFEFTLVDNFQKIQCLQAPSEHEFKSLKEYFKKRDKDAFMNPAVKAGFIDGFTDFFDDVYLPVGLWGELQNYVTQRGYNFVIHGLDVFLNFHLKKDDIVEFMNDLFEDTEIKPRWYQYESVFRILKYRYSAQQLSTSSGKTMISYAVSAYLKHTGQVHNKKKFVLIVPRKGLVKQTYDKFMKVYDNGTVPMKVMPLGGQYKFNKKKYDECDVLITTYQSLNNRDSSMFEVVGSINVDEGHTAKTESISKAIKLSSPLRYRFGLSGTLMVEMEYSDYYKNLENLGPVTMIYDPKDLIEDGFAPNVNIKQVLLNYSQLELDEYILKYKEFKKNKPTDDLELIRYYKDLYTLERSMILSDDTRLNEIVNYVGTELKKNTLILFNDVKGEYGKHIYDKLTALGKHCKYIDGSTKDNDRYDYTDEIEDRDDMYLIASYGTFSTGIDLKNVHYVVLAESFKSPILIGQSIGRGLRELIDKHFITIIDFIDLLFKHTVKQSKIREELYKKQNYSITKEEIFLKN